MLSHSKYISTSLGILIIVVELVLVGGLKSVVDLFGPKGPPTQRLAAQILNSLMEQPL
jgi:hypothetical protein